ncbi:AMP-binding enzyme [Actinomadura latina]|uniref:AMP-binding enzyme n=1 Tax=Actinomadura latina TaxID=163603 RepID=UPI00082E0388
MVHGRGSGCINSGGEKIFPAEVEQILKSHPSVMDVLVAGVPDERFGKRVGAVVKLRDDAGNTAAGSSASTSIGFQAAAPLGREDVLLSLAAQVEQAAPWPLLAPT